MNKLALLLFTTNMVSLGLAQVMITNGPMDTTVCSGRTVNISCGFIGADPSTTIPDWIIIRRSDDGSVISNMTIGGNAIVRNNVDELQWVPDRTTGGNNAPNSYLIVGPVDETYDQSSYQCIITTIGGTVVSTIGTLTVAGVPTVNNLMVADSCLDVTASWTPITGPCSISVQYMATLISSGGIMEQVVTSNTSYTFSNTLVLIGSVYVRVVVFNDNAIGNSPPPVQAQPSGSNIPQITIPTVVERCVSYLYITWTDTTQCVPVNYTVMLTNTSSGELLHNDTTSNNSYNFTGLTSDTSYTITITGRNRVGQDVEEISNSTLKSNAPPMVSGVMPSSITTQQQAQDITISWMAPLILDPCTTSMISSYEVQIEYIINNIWFTVNSSVPANTISILMSEYYPGHPLAGTTYNITVVAVNEGGRSVANTSPCDCDCGSSDDDDLSTGAAVAISIVVTFIITLVVTTLISVIITRMCYKYRFEHKEQSISKNNDTQEYNQFVLMGRDVKIDNNPSYAVMDKETIKMDTNPAYAVTK